MKFSRIALASSALAVAFAVAGCSSTKKAEEPAPTPVAATPEPEPTPAPAPVPEVTLKTIYFDFNKYEIREDQRENANTMASSMKENPNQRFQIQGNTDDRGSAEYNMALGEKRAQALKDYLVANGVSASNLETVSYGKERPAMEGNGEKVWSENRRDDVIKITNP